MPNRRFNLFPKQNWRFALADEIKPDWRKVPFVVVSALLSSDREWLTRRRSCPAWQALVSCEAQGERPSANTCKEMTLVEFAHISGVNISN
nr:hypothetical protein [Novacetimonas hansenii]